MFNLLKAGEPIWRQVLITGLNSLVTTTTTVFITKSIEKYFEDKKEKNA